MSGRKVILVAVLLASHGAVLWQGTRPHAAEAGAPVRAIEASEPRDPALGVESLRRRAAGHLESQAKVKAERDKVQALRDKIPADADVEGMVRIATQKLDPLDSRVLDLRTVAAYGIWIDRDPLAALRWLAEWDPRGESRVIGAELIRHLELGNFAKLGEYLKAVPGAQAFLTSADVFVTLKSVCDPATRVAAVSGLPDGKMRFDWLTELFEEPADLRGQMAKIRASLDAGKAAQFLDQLPPGLDPKLLDEIRGAGFAPAALERFLREYAAYAEESAAERAQSEAVPWSDRLAEWRRNQLLNSDYKGEFEKLCPDYNDWCDEVADGRMDPEEMLARVAAALPGEGEEPALREVFFQRYYRDNPRAAAAWLQKSGLDVKEVLLNTVLSIVPVEIEGEIMATLLGNELPVSKIETLTKEYRELAPERRRELAGKLPAGPLKDALEADLERSEEQ